MSCEILGREKVQYTLNITNDINNTSYSIIDNSTDWSIADQLLDSTDNTQLILDSSYSSTQEHIYESPGLKSVKTLTDFDDGWGNIYEHETNLLVNPIPYDTPILDFSWTPVEPTLLTPITLEQNHTDTRDINTKFGRIDEVRIDYYNDNSYEEDFITKNDQSTYQFLTKEDGIQIRLNAVYWDGWEHQETELIKTLNMANIPPESKWLREDKGVCVPAYEWTATSTDLDDNDQDLTFEWKLYQLVGTVYNLTDTGTGNFYKYPFQFEGTYKLELITTDTEGSQDTKEEIFDIVFSECNGSGTGEMSGTLRLQLGGFQLVALPIEGKKVSDLVDKMAEKAGVNDFEIVNVCNAAPGNSTAIGNFFNYVPGNTNKLSSNNFDLIMNDSGIKEVTGFWIETKSHPSLDYIDINWNSSTGEIS